MKANPLADKHDVLSEIKFRLKVLVLTARRQIVNLLHGPEKFGSGNQFPDSPVIAISTSALWTADDNEKNWILTAGKIQNLRIAVKRINGLEIPAGKAFSFWKHIGNPNFAKGYVIGREIREGCIVPTKAGGLCQLSNALYDAALNAGFEITERHKHTRVISGSLAERNRDATVKWNYVDLRFKSKYAFKIEAELTSDQLMIRFRGNPTGKVKQSQTNGYQFLPSTKLNDCYSCGNLQCFKHPAKAEEKSKRSVTTYVLDEKWAEYDEYIQQSASANDIFIVPTYKNRFINSSRYRWSVKGDARVFALDDAMMYRSLILRLKKKSNVFSLMLKLDKKLAKAAAKRIPIESTHLVISQNLLPFLWQEGILGGRTFDVLMTRLPMEILHRRLNEAHAKFPQSATLHDFRASETLIAAENAALTASRRVITPHSEVASIFGNKVVRLNWIYPKTGAIASANNRRVLFPASALGRKGAFEMRQLARDLDLRVLLTGRATEHDGFWGDVPIEFAGEDTFAAISMVVYPAYVENHPKMLLKAIAKGLPVIATAACGLEPAANLIIVPTGDYDALKQAVMMQLDTIENKNLVYT